MLNMDELIFLLDVDNTLLDNDRFAADLGDRLEQAFGPSERTAYWAIFGRLRQQLGFADYLASLQEFRTGLDDHPDLLEMYKQFLLEYPFVARLFPRTLEAIAHVSAFDARDSVGRRHSSSAAQDSASGLWERSKAGS